METNFTLTMLNLIALLAIAGVLCFLLYGMLKGVNMERECDKKSSQILLRKFGYYAVFGEGMVGMRVAGFQLFTSTRTFSPAAQIRATLI